MKKNLLFALSFVLLISSCKPKQYAPPPKAEFTYTINPEGNVDFINVSTNAVTYDYAIENKHINTKDFSYHYGYNGTYQVSLIVTNSEGVSDVIVKTIKISNVTGSVVFWKGTTVLYADNIVVVIDGTFTYVVNGRITFATPPLCGTLNTVTKGGLSEGEHQYRFIFGSYLTTGKFNIIGGKCVPIEVTK